LFNQNRQSHSEQDSGFGPKVKNYLAEENDDAGEAQDI
jgi:hypothetical protein